MRGAPRTGKCRRHGVNCSKLFCLLLAQALHGYKEHVGLFHHLNISNLIFGDALLEGLKLHQPKADTTKNLVKMDSPRTLVDFQPSKGNSPHHLLLHVDPVVPQQLSEPLHRDIDELLASGNLLQVLNCKLKAVIFHLLQPIPPGS